MGLTGAVSSSVGHLRFRAGRLSNPEVCLTSLDKPEGLAGEPSVPRGQCSTVDEEAAMEPRDRRPGSGPLCVTPRRAARIWSSLCARVKTAWQVTSQYCHLQLPHFGGLVGGATHHLEQL